MVARDSFSCLFCSWIKINDYCVKIGSTVSNGGPEGANKETERKREKSWTRTVGWVA